MILKKWDSLPEDLRNTEVKKYYDILKKKPFRALYKTYL